MTVTIVPLKCESFLNHQRFNLQLCMGYDESESKTITTVVDSRWLKRFEWLIELQKSVFVLVTEIHNVKLGAYIWQNIIHLHK